MAKQMVYKLTDTATGDETDFETFDEAKGGAAFDRLSHYTIDSYQILENDLPVWVRTEVQL